MFSLTKDKHAAIISVCIAVLVGWFFTCMYYVGWSAYYYDHYMQAGFIRTLFFNLYRYIKATWIILW